jgi:hypothetical protein
MKTYKHPRNDGTPSRSKFKGFNYYIQSNEKLSKSNRKRLLKESETHLNEVIGRLGLSGECLISSDIPSELDPNHSDYELLEIWNKVYDDFGYLMSKFQYQWEKEHSKGEKLNQQPTIIQTLLSEVESLKSRVKSLENSKLISEPSRSLGF